MSLLNATAVKVANQSPVSDEVSLSAEAVALMQAKSEVAANVAVFRAADEIQRALLNIVG